MSAQMVFDALRLLTPMDVPGIGKRRIGGQGDGAYVLLDRLDPSQVIMSFGIGWTVEFDLEMAKAGHRIIMFDHTIGALPAEHPNFTWHCAGLAGVSDPAASLFTLQEQMAKLPEGTVDPILKMDIEGFEWAVLGTTPRETLARFAQITLEFHNLLDLDQPVVNARAQLALRALLQDFALVHVHGNNFGTIGSVGGFASVETLEATYVRRDLFPTVPSKTLYPTPYDTPNFDEKEEYKLWFFPYLPGSENLTL